MRSILILDDERVLREAFVDYFEDRLWRPIPAGRAEKALKILEDKSPDAALVDIRLPGMDGDQFIRRATQMKPKMAFVILTGSPEYVIPSDLKKLVQVADKPYNKPVTRLRQLEQEIIQVMKRIEGAEIEIDE